MDFLHILIHDDPAIKLPQNLFPSGTPHGFLALVRELQEFFNGKYQSISIPRGAGYTGYAVVKGLADTGDIGSDGGSAAGSGLQKHVGHALMV
jgi:hypothetical protein